MNNGSKAGSYQNKYFFPKTGNIVRKRSVSEILTTIIFVKIVKLRPKPPFEAGLCYLSVILRGLCSAISRFIPFNSVEDESTSFHYFIKL